MTCYYPNNKILIPYCVGKVQHDLVHVILQLIIVDPYWLFKNILEHSMLFPISRTLHLSFWLQHNFFFFFNHCFTAGLGSSFSCQFTVASPPITLYSLSSQLKRNRYGNDHNSLFYIFSFLVI